MKYLATLFTIAALAAITFGCAGKVKTAPQTPSYEALVWQCIEDNPTDSGIEACTGTPYSTTEERN